MDELLSKRKKKKGFCCCREESSGDESVITIDRASFASFEPVVVQKFAISRYASDKVYLITSASKYFLITVRNIMMKSKTSDITTNRPGKYSYLKISTFTIKEEESLKDISQDKFISDKTVKKLGKLVLSRKEVKNCVVVTSRVCFLALQMARFCNVISLEEEKIIEELVQMNLALSNQEFKINLIEGNLFSLPENTETDLILINAIKKHYEEQEISDKDMNVLKETIRQALKFVNDVVVILPYSADPAKICEVLADFQIAPILEFIIFSDSDSIKHIILLVGGVAKFNMHEVILNLSGKLGLSAKQNHLVKKIIDMIGIAETLKIFQEAEKKGKKKSKAFFESAKKLGCTFPEIKVLFVGPDGAKLVKELETFKEFFFTYESESSALEIDGKRIEGEMNIIQYLEELKNSESCINSLLNLMDG